jgi:hypothetical protein
MKGTALRLFFQVCPLNAWLENQTVAMPNYSFYRDALYSLKNTLKSDLSVYARHVAVETPVPTEA